jgi:FkbM family methyltransferase
MHGFRKFVTSRLRADNKLTQAAVRTYGKLSGVDVRFLQGVITFRREHREIRISSANFPYTSDMINHFDAYYGVVVPDKQGVVDYSCPRVHRYMKSGVEFHLPSIAEEEEALASYFRWYTPKPGDLVFDLGAHAGVSTHRLSQAVGATGRVFAFEPDPTAWKSLLLNIDKLSMTNVFPINKAVAEQSGKLVFQAEGSLGSALASVASRPSTKETLFVDAITFEQACTLAGAQPAFVKMDIEGAELEVIKSALQLLRGSSIHFAIDTNHTVGGELTNARVEQLFAAVDFECVSSDESGFMTTWARPVPTKYAALGSDCSITR